MEKLNSKDRGMLKKIMGKHRQKVLIFLKNIGAHYITFIGFLFLIVYMDNTDIVRSKVILGVNLYAITLFTISVAYLIRYRPRDKKIDSLSDDKEYKRWIKFFREIIWSVLLILISLMVLSLFIKDKNYFYTLYIILLIRFFTSIMMILTDWKLVQLILIGIVAALVSRIIGVFNIKWWAFISGSLLLWNYINSKDFLILLNKGLIVENIPPSLELRWQKNRLMAYVVTVITYLTFIISSFFEKKDMEISEKAIIRIVVFGITLFILVIIYILIQYVFDRRKSKKRNFLDNVLNWLGIRKYIDKISDYVDLHKKVILDNKN